MGDNRLWFYHSLRTIAVINLNLPERLIDLNIICQYDIDSDN